MWTYRVSFFVILLNRFVLALFLFCPYLGSHHFIETQIFISRCIENEGRNKSVLSKSQLHILIGLYDSVHGDILFRGSDVRS